MQPGNNPLLTLDPEGHIDRRKMIYHNAPMGEIAEANNTIKYHPQQNEWECLKCGRKEKTAKTNDA